MFEIFFKKEENGPLQKNYKTETARRLGRNTKEEIGKGNQMTALRSQTGVKQTSVASIQGSSKLKVQIVE